jgi:hypothetical protein
VNHFAKYPNTLGGDRNEELVKLQCLLAVTEDGVDLELAGAVAGMRERKKTLAFSRVAPPVSGSTETVCPLGSR